MRLGILGAVWAVAAGANAWMGAAAPYAAAPMCALEGPASVAVAVAAPAPISTLREANQRPTRPSICPPPDEPGLDTPVTAEDGRKAFAEAQRLAASGHPEQAFLQLKVVESAFPRVADRISLREGRLLLAAGKPDAARRAFERAQDSLDDTTRVRADVGRVRALIATGDPDAEGAIADLQHLYPELPVLLDLRYELGRAQEEAGNRHTAARIYRSIDLTDPASGVAQRARARLAALARQGLVEYALPATERVQRLERLAAYAPPTKVEAEIGQIDALHLPNDLRSRVALIEARLARRQGRWNDAQRYLLQARRTGSLPKDVSPKELKEKAEDLAEVADARDAERATKDIERIVGRRPLERLPYHKLRAVLDLAVPAGLTDTADGVLNALDAMQLPSRYLFDAATGAFGTASDAVEAAVLSHLVDDARYGVAARYHYARALEGQGRWTEAEAQLLKVRALDDPNLGWYRMWAGLRLRKVHEEMVAHCKPADLALGMAASSYDPALAELGTSCTAPLPEKDPAPQAPPRFEGMDPVSTLPRPPAADPPNANTLANALRPVSEAFGDAYPWLPRALDLLTLGDTSEAADELHETYLAWRSAIGSPLRRAGLLSVYRGDNLPPRRVTWTILRDRRAMDDASLRTLSDVAAGLGDTGVSMGFGGTSRAGTRPRAYADLVWKAARRHGLDPNLLFAVMRVESVYQRRIVSYAGAIGLMQIMPRTGRLIASALGEDDFTAEELLDPETNLDFAAWYLASLIRRFDGRLPLAIASYNGGPHNVRRWMEEYSPDMPLDAFLERIPFDQTFRYVRRVLTHYAAYRAEQGLPMEQLTTVLPPQEPDSVGF